MDECIFCQVVKKEIPANFVLETDEVVSFPDINPAAKVHLLILPKQHIENFLSISDTHEKILKEMRKAAQKLISENGLDKDGYRLVFNGGRFQHVPHLHWHLLGGILQKMV